METTPSKGDGGTPQLSSIEEGCVRTNSYRDLKMPALPKSLTLEEKKFLLAVERGDLTSVKRIIHRVKRHHGSPIDLNCMDPLGRGALLMAIDNENLQMVELLVVMGIATRDALLHAIDKEFVEAVELLLEHEELIHKEGEPYSWESVDRTTSSFTPDITPLVLAAHRNNYEILKILLDRGATIPAPHDVQCGCDECIRGVMEDSLRHSMSRINAYRALSSPSLIALSSIDPILTAFELSVELKRLAYLETEFRQEYMELRRQCQQFACDLLSHTRSSTELAFLLNHDPTSPPQGLSTDIQQMKLARLELAIDNKQKKFVAHPNIQQLLAAIWYEGLPGFRRKSPLQKMMEIALIALLFPLYCALYMIAPSSAYAQLMRKPFMKFLIHASSYLFFLFLLILVSQRFDVHVIQMFGTESMRINLEDQLRRQRGNGPTLLECFVAVYIIGYIYEEVCEMWKEGLGRYIRNMWNVIDVCRDVSYLMVMVLRVIAYVQQQKEIEENPAAAYVPREEWDAFDPQLVAEGVCAMANIFSALKLVHLFSINPYLGPLQISLGRMVIDIVKFFFIYTLVLFAFACGMNQLLWYFSDLEKQKCFTLPGGLPDWNKNPEACAKWRRFANLFESSQSLFWASFGLVDLGNFELAGVKSYTRFWSMLIYGAYSVINVVVLLNLLIAMMSNSYSLITEHSDTEWKFARSKLWMSYFDATGNTLPPPFNLLPSPKKIMRIFCRKSTPSNSRLRRTSSKGRRARERDYCYAAVMRSLVWRYVTAMHRRQEMSQVTEDDVNEVKGDISTLRFELLDVFKNNGMDISCANKNTKAALGRKMRIWERRLLRDFHVVSVAGGAEDEEDQEGEYGESFPEKRGKDTGADKFRKLASAAVAMNAAGISHHGLTGVIPPKSRTIKPLSQIGKSMSNESFKSSQNLRKAMEEAQRLTVVSPTPDASPNHTKYSASPLPLLPDSGSSVLELLRSISNEEDEEQKQENAVQKKNDTEDVYMYKLPSQPKEKLVDPLETSISTALPSSSKFPWKYEKAEVRLLSPIVDPNVKENKIRSLSAKKAPSPPIPLQKNSNQSEGVTSPVTDLDTIDPLLSRESKIPPSGTLGVDNKISMESEIQQGEVNRAELNNSQMSTTKLEKNVPSETEGHESDITRMDEKSNEHEVVLTNLKETNPNEVKELEVSTEVNELNIPSEVKETHVSIKENAIENVSTVVPKATSEDVPAPLSFERPFPPSVDSSNADLQLLQNLNPTSSAFEIQMQTDEKKGVPICPTEEKRSVDNVKTIKRQTSKGWF